MRRTVERSNHDRPDHPRRRRARRRVEVPGLPGPAGSDSVRPEKRAAVLAAVEELGYRPNAAARSLSERRTRTVGVLLNDLRNPWYVDLLDGLNTRLYDSGLHVLLADGHLNRRLGRT